MPPSALQFEQARINEIAPAMFDLFDDNDDLNDFLLKAIKKPVKNFGVSKKLQETINSVLAKLNAQWHVHILLDGLRQEFPDNQVIYRIAAKNGMAALSEEGLEAMIDASAGIWNLGVLMAGMGVVEFQVCQIRHAGKKVGTGFLVGKDLVLTNYHVVKNHLDSPDWTAHFDYKTHVNKSTGQQSVLDGTSVPLAKENWLVDHSFAVDHVPGEPNKKLLDYALLRLCEPKGEEVLSKKEGTRRGWLKLDPQMAIPDVPTPILIVQHPLGEPMGLSYNGSVEDTKPQIGRIFHTSNTEAGSSGSPCLNHDFKVVALHRGWVDETKNQAVPIAPIARRIIDAKVKLEDPT
jgi:V8-like Glu-specific endopeptidase